MNVGTADALPYPQKWQADLASGDRAQQGRGSVVVAGVTPRSGDDKAGYRAKGASSTDV